MSLSTVEGITKVVDYDPAGFSFLSTVGELIGNREYQHPYQQYMDGGDNSHTFYWKALSAVGDELAETVYDNVRNYIQCVSDVDTCKVKALRSMMQLFNYKCTVLDNFISMPQEVLKLIDILSIDKKYLAKAGFIRPEFAADMAAGGIFKDYSRDPEGQGLFQGVDFRSDFTDCTYTVSTDARSVGKSNVNQMQWKYGAPEQISDFYVSSFVGLCVEYGKDGVISNRWLDQARLSTLTSEYGAYGYPLSAVQQISSLDSARMYVNKKNYRLIDDRQYEGGNGRIYVHDGNLRRLFFLNTSYNGMRYPGDRAVSALSSVYAEISSFDTSAQYDIKWLSSNFDKKIAFTLSNDSVSYDSVVFDDDAYLGYIKSIYKRLLYGYITLPYNLSINYLTHVNKLYAYPYLDSDYFDISAKYAEYVDYEDDSILSVKLRNHVNPSFNEKRIYDDIEAGRDSLDAYAGTELCVLLLEKARREEPLSPTTTKLPSRYSNSQLNLKQNQTRYSYYRRRKVIEYANFVDSYYAVLQNSGMAAVYDFDTNYWQLSSSVSTTKVITRPTSIENVNPEKDINVGMIDIVADYLAMATQYVCKLRHEIKLQTQKNYMRGTNLLLIYIINEYLRDYAKHNKLSGDILRSDSEFQEIQKKLENHSLEGTSHQGYSVNIQEYYDATEYFNIATNSTCCADMSAHVNPRYWELTSFENTEIMKKDGEAFKLAEIEKFYLSALSLERPVSGDLPAFLSTIYDAGANNTFIFKDLSDDLSIYSSVLSDGQFASDIFDRLISLSGAYTTFVSTYLSNGSYSYPEGTVISQISDMLSSYVYPNLSAQYLVGISDVYDKYKIQLDSLSSSVGSLSTSYVRFVQTTYTCYYSKSESKFCYTDHDPVTGQYIFPYFNGNPDYDRAEDNLYNHLYQLQVYSTESNIKNFALISTLTYIDNEMHEISGNLQTQVIADLTKDCGFTDINAPTLDNEFQYTYNFINGLITSRQDFLKSQLASIQTQAQSLKTSYDTLNNTFTNAVANFNDNNDGYKLGDSKVYWFSTYQDSKNGTAKREDTPPTKTEWDYAIYVGDAGCKCWYCGINGKKKGDYIKDETDVTPYSASDSLDARCDEVLEYMRAPTSKTQSSSQYGLMNEGIVAVCDNVKNGLVDIQTSFDNIAEQAENLFGVEKPQQTDIYSNILELIKKLTEVDESSFTSDEKTQKYKGYFAKVVQLSSSYVPVKTEYTRIFTDKAQTNYLTGFSRQEGLTFENIQELSTYIVKTDKSNYAAITETINKFINVDYQNLLITKSNLQIKMEEDKVPDVHLTTGNDVETRIFEMNDGLLKDVSNKYEAAIKAIDAHKFLIHNRYKSGYFNVITSEISVDLDTTKKFTSCVKASLDRLNFFDHDIYRKYKDMFLTYGGRDFCYDPYYNMKNVTHPSYQIHPYLWNFVKKLDGNTLINSGFRANVVDSLIESNVLDWLKRRDGIGEFGQTVNTWQSSNIGMIDYSGYRSMYERGSNWSAKLNCVHEVVDYEGAFYPPALNEYRGFAQQSVSSVYEQATRNELYVRACKTLDNQLTDRISSYVTFNEDGTVQLSAQSQFAVAVSSLILSYVPGARCGFNRTINDYLSLATTTVSTLNWVGVKSALYDGIPETFYEKYYSQVELTKNEARRIGLQLQEYKDEILELTDPRPEAEQYDIYKYGIDINKTHYALFKKYDYSSVEEIGDLSYDAKRNTLGRMWIRQGDHPIAFPAFSGANPSYYIGSTNHLAPVIIQLAQKLSGDSGITWGDRPHTIINSINDRLEYFYDFEIAGNKASLAYIIFDPKYPLGVDFYRQFKLANVTVGKVDTYQDDIADVLYLKFNNSAAEAGKIPIDYIDFHKGNTFGYVSEQDILSTDVLLSTGVQYPALVGYHLFDNNSINLVYAYQDFKASRAEGEQLSDLTQVHSDMSQKVRSFVVQAENGNSYRKIPEEGMTFDVESARFGNRKIVGGSMCIGYNGISEQLTLAYVTELTSGLADLVKAETISGTMAIDAATDGAIITDPLAPEMNSHDKLTQNITLVEAQYKQKTLKFKRIRDYNTNADISYIPTYPGYEHEFNMPSCYGTLDTDLCCRIVGGDYHNIELLGESKDIERYIALVNPNPDPYFDYQSVKENTEFGRVYEDYKVEFEKTFTMVENPSLNFNSPPRYGHKYSIESTPNQFVWTINLNKLNPTPFGLHDLKTMQIIIYNADTLGKNPYYIGKLWDFITEQELNYNKPVVDDNNADFETSCVVPVGSIKITGTHRDIHTHSERDTNHIDMIDRITAALYAKADDLASATLTLTFDIDQNAQLKQFAKVPQGELKIMLYNNKDLEIYQYYHMLDAYGAVQCRFFESLDDKPDQPDDGRGWGIYYPKAAHTATSALTQSFFKDKSGLKTYLDSIELSDYDNLSDVYVYRGNKMLSFKNEETYRFPTSSDLYYYPMLNISYPKKAANYVELNTSFAVNGAANTSVMYDIFDDRNLFVMTLEDASYIADKIGQVDIPVLYNDVEDVRAYEDYFDYAEVSTGLSAYNYQRYDVGDPRIAQYLHFTSDAGVGSGSGLAVPDSSWKNKSVEDFASWLATTSSVYASKSEEVAQGVETEYITTYASRQTCDIAKFLRFYVNYRRDYEDQSLDLYFNYFNYIDSPYVKLENGTEMKIDTIESTYLKLKSGEDGVLDIIVQFKHYIGGVLYGYKNVKVLSYHIYNISDDKPKFLMYKTYEVQNGQSKHQVERGTVTFQVDSVNIQLEDYMSSAPDEPIAGAFRVVAYSDKALASPFDFYFDYPSHLLNVQPSGAGYYIDESNSSLGLLHVIVTNPGQKSYLFEYETKYTARELLRYKNRKYSVSVDEATVYDCDGLACQVEFADASIQFTYTTSNLLGIVKEHVPAGAYVAADSSRSVVNLSNVR